MSGIKQIAVIVGILLFACCSMAEITLPQFYTDNMVLQQNSKVTMPGVATPGSKVTLSADWLARPVNAKAGSDGRFSLEFTTPKAGGPYTLIVSDGEDCRALQNVLVGEVWLCSGQSNMEFPVKGDWAQLMNADEVVATMQRPALRLLQIRNTTSVTPLDDASVEFGWVESSPAASSVSAIGYLCGKMLQDSLNVPVGIIDATWGGTPVEAWTPHKYLKGVPGFEFYHDLLVAGKDEQQLIEAAMVKVYNDYDEPKKIVYPFDKGVMQTGRAWGRMPVPSLWEENVLPGFDGIVVMQFELDLPAAAAGKPLRLCLGAVDDWDITYFNGEHVGGGRIFDQLRDYQIEGNLVKAGKNVITVEVIDNAGGGGIWKSSYAIVDGKRYSLDGEWNYAVLSDFSRTNMSYLLPDTPQYPSVLYNAMIEPLTVMPIAGTFWYQGCANVGRDAQYEICFKNMITGWRDAFGNPDMPFYFVQLAGFQQPVTVQPHSEWAALRRAQTKALELPNTGMATAIDLGNPVDIHPTNKAEVARRLTLLALDRTYGRKQICIAPAHAKIGVNGRNIMLSFDKPVHPIGGVVTGFIIGDKEGKWAYAHAEMEGDRTIRLSSPLIDKPVAVRYNWADYPGGNLYGENNLPVLPFSISNNQM